MTVCIVFNFKILSYLNFSTNFSWSKLVSCFTNIKTRICFLGIFDFEQRSVTVIEDSVIVGKNLG